MNLTNFMNLHALTILLCILSFTSQAQQTLTGSFPPLAHQQVTLYGFEGFGTYPIDSTRIDENGVFKLRYASKDRGMGYLVSADNKPFIVILGGEDIRLKGDSFSQPETIEIPEGKENQLFGQYATEHPRREQALSAWVYLERIYQQDPLFATHQTPKNSIEAEKRRITDEDHAFLASLDPQSYVSWFLPVRKLVSAVPAIAQYRTDEIPGAIAAFRNMDYTDHRLYKSGLLRETIENHFWLIENSGRSLDSVIIEMNASIDHMIENLSVDEKKLNEITDYLFNLLEQRSLFGASEYLALKVLNEVSCTIDDKLANQMESYRAMKIGNTAPEIVFLGDIFRNGKSTDSPVRLSEVKAKYTLIVFGSAWCPMCTQELSAIQSAYNKWQSHGVEVVYISLDEDQTGFRNSASGYSFFSFSDYKKWESPAAKDYHVFATPTLFLLDKDRKILLRPNSARHMNSWVDWVLVQGNR
jgi:peroxiredoxin